MLVLTIRTDKPEAEIGLYEDNRQQACVTWQAHRRLAETLHQKIADVLSFQGLALEKVEGIVCYKGPGSFTGLRIGLSVGNALAYGLQIPIVAANGENWQHSGVVRLQKGENETIAVPEYGAPVFFTKPKK